MLCYPEVTEPYGRELYGYDTMLTLLESWRQTYFGSPANAGDAEDTPFFMRLKVTR
jgi:hypothetical protein